MKTPNITPAQLVGLTTSLGGLAVAFGLVSGAQDRVVIAAATAAIGVGLKLADAIIRHGRSRSLAGVQASAIAHEAAAPAPTESSSTTTAGTVEAASSSVAS